MNREAHRIEVLCLQGCPHAEETTRLVRDVASRLLPGTEVFSRTVSEAEMREAGGAGSPTILVDGRDIEGTVVSSSGDSLRTYGTGGVPPEWMIEAGILRALRPRHILFLCVANSARSQMAEGIARVLAPRGVSVSSAGSERSSVRPQAIQVLGEIGIDISGHRSKGLGSIDAGSVDAVITLCAEEVCPAFLGKAHRLHWGLTDPAGITGTEEARLDAFRSVRDELRRRLKVLFGHGEDSAVKTPHAIAIVGNSGAGKTTLLERLIPALKRKGVRVGVVKHDAHRFDIDHPGKDSHRLTAAGADTMMITSGEKLAMVKRHAASPPIEELLETYFTDMDLVLVEGFRGSSLPKIEVHRKELRRALICRGERNDPGLAAVASDEPLDLDVPVLDLNDPGSIAEFIASLASCIGRK